jgi:L-aminopeptidase/D-esterase-like protein
MKNIHDSLIDIAGIQVGHAQNLEAMTGCTVVICKKGAIGGVDQRGGAPGTRETDLLRPMHLVSKIHAIILCGGSAYGLDAAGGVMRFLEERKIGFNAGKIRVPIVSAAVIYDRDLGNPKIRPDAEMGYQACLNADSSRFPTGNVGAGTGATVGKVFGIQHAMKSGIGTACEDLGNGLLVGALIVANAFGDVVDPKIQKIIAGARPFFKGSRQSREKAKFADTMQVLKTPIAKTILSIADARNTVIGVIVTNATLTKEDTNKVAQMSHDGLANTIFPAHTMFDGDTLFALSTGKVRGDVNIIGAYAARAVSRAIVDAVKSAKSIAGLPAFETYH